MQPIMEFFKWAVILVIGLPSLIIWFLMLLDCAFRDFGPYEHRNNKTLWLIVIFLTNIVGALLYYFFVRRPAKRRDFGGQREM